MDPIILFVIVVFIVLVLIAVLSSRKPGRRANENGIEERTFVFQESQEDLIPSARRRVRIIAPSQMVGGERRPLQIDAQSVPGVVGDPPANKGIDAVVVVALNPRVYPSGMDDELVNFDPPLRVTLDYKAEDTKDAEFVDGKPKLSIATAYEADGGWRFERLVTDVTPGENGGGTLEASVTTLAPLDPLLVTRP